MSIEVVLEGRLEDEKDFEGYLRLLKEISTTWQLKMEAFETSALIEACPEGYIEVSYDGTFMNISAQTNVAGPGFHAYVCSFYDEIIKQSPVELIVNDPTNYFYDRSFDKLKKQVFYRWLSDLGEYIKGTDETEENVTISWPLDYYRPQEKRGFVVTPMGYITREDFQNLDIEQLADHFFVWNKIGRDAKYYRNAALNLLWKECFYEYTNMNEYTEKIADTIMDYIEIAYEIDPTLPLPLSEYQELANQRGRVPKITEGTHMYIQQIGYRRNIVEYQYRNWSILADGFCEKSMDDSNQTLYLMAPYKEASEPWKWMYKINAYTYTHKITSFLPAISQPEHAYETFRIDHDDIEGMGYIEKMDDHHLLQAQLNCGTEMLIVQVIICDEDDIPMIMKNVQKIICRSVVEDVLKN